MSGKRRVYEVARDLGMENKAFVALLESLGVPEVKNHMSVISPESEDRVKRHLGKSDGSKASSGAKAAETESSDRIHPSVVKRPAVVRRRKAADGSTEETSAAAKHPADHDSIDAAPAHVVVDVHEPAHVEAAPVERVAAPAAAPAVAPAEPAAPAAEPVVVAVAAPVETVKAPVEAAPVAPAPVSAPVESAPVAVAAPAAPPAEPAPSAPSATVPSATVPSATVPSATSATAPSAPVAPAARPAVQPAAAAPAPAPAAAAQESAPVRPTGSVAPQGGANAPSVRPPTPSTPPKTGIDVWEGRPGVPMHLHRPGPRRVQYDAKAPSAGPGGVRRGPPGGAAGSPMMGGGPMMGGPGGRMGRNKPRGIGSFGKARGTGAPVTKERSAHKKVVRIEETVSLQNLAGSMGTKATDLLRKLFQLGMPGININTTLDADTAKIVAAEFGWEVEDVAVSEEEQLQKAQGLETEESEEGLEARPPVVTVMGHVDHGKTSLLDALRKTNVVSGEAGGITQHIGAYSVDTAHGKVTFLDTPGHAAFTAMRARGAQATDLVVLVVAADDGVMPQTKEAISHAKAAEVPIVVAINKIDKPEAQPERVRRELADQGLVPEEWGGDTMFCEVSAHTKQGLPEMLEKLALQAEIMELKANPNKPASGLVVESELDRGRGPVATVLVTEGTLRTGDVILAGAGYGKVRAMQDWDGRLLKEVGPSGPASIVGLSEVPRAGDQVYVVKDLKTAAAIAETRKVKERRSLAPSAGNKPRTLEEIARLMGEQEQLELKVIVKADVAGSAEAVADSLLQLSTEKVRVSVVLQAAGAITENDVNLAVAAGGIILGFNVKDTGKAAQVAQREGVEIRNYTIIYNLLDDVKLAMEGLLAPKLVEKEIGKAEVRQTFRVSKAGTVAGSMVIEGVVRRGALARLFREGNQIWEGKLSGLRRFKEDVREVKDGFECGISLENMDEIHVGDVIAAFEVEQVKQSL